MSARSGRYISIRNRAVPFGRHLYEAYEHILCNRRLSLTTRPCAGKTMRFITKRDIMAKNLKKISERPKSSETWCRWHTGIACVLLTALLFHIMPQLRAADHFINEKTPDYRPLTYDLYGPLLSCGLYGDMLYFNNYMDEDCIYCVNISHEGEQAQAAENVDDLYEFDENGLTINYTPAFLYCMYGILTIDESYIYRFIDNELHRYSKEAQCRESLCSVQGSDIYVNSVYYGEKIYYMGSGEDLNSNTWYKSLSLYVVDLKTLESRELYRFSIPEGMVSTSTPYRYYYSRTDCRRFCIQDDKIYFVDQGLYVMDLDGSNLQELIPGSRYVPYLCPTILDGYLYVTARCLLGDIYLKADLKGNVLAMTRIYETHAEYAVQSTIVIDGRVLCRKNDALYLCDFETGEEDPFPVNSVRCIFQFTPDLYVVEDGRHFYLFQDGNRYQIYQYTLHK